MRASDVFVELARFGPVLYGEEDAVYRPILMGYGLTPYPPWGWGLGVKRPILLVAHLDTVRGRKPWDVVVRGGIARGEGGMMGADDKAGVALVLTLSQALEHPEVGFALFHGEEVGCVGSGEASRILTPKAVISLDRKGTGEVIYVQMGTDTGSKEAAGWLAKSLGMGHRPSENGVWTDSEAFADVSSECLNLAVGYQGAHTDQDTQDLIYLDELAEALREVRWGDMPLVREPEGRRWG